MDFVTDHTSRITDTFHIMPAWQCNGVMRMRMSKDVQRRFSYTCMCCVDMLCSRYCITRSCVEIDHFTSTFALSEKYSLIIMYQDIITTSRYTLESFIYECMRIHKKPYGMISNVQVEKLNDGNQSKRFWCPAVSRSHGTYGTNRCRCCG